MRTIIHAARLPAARGRAGNILVLAAAASLMILAFTAFTVDVGYLALTRAQMQNAADAAALAAAMELSPTSSQTDVEEVARQAAAEMVACHQVRHSASMVIDPTLDVEFGRRTTNALGVDSTTWGPTATPYNVVRVHLRLVQRAVEVGSNGTTSAARLPLVFAPVIGHDNAALQVSAIASFQPRDMVLVHDYSASMNDYSEYRHIDRLGREEVEHNIHNIWQALGSPQYGNLEFDPQYVTAHGVPYDSSRNYPHISVKWRGTRVDVTSTNTIHRVLLFFEGGGNQTKTGSGTTGTFQGSSSDSGRIINHVLVESWGNKALDPWYGQYGELFSFDNAGLKKILNLNGVPYPYAAHNSGWEGFFDYVRTSSHVNEAGYRYQFGIMSLINYWNDRYPGANQTPNLHTVPQQPVTALKEAADVLLDYLIEHNTKDQVGFVSYTYPPGGGAKLETPLTLDYHLVKNISRSRQAGHYYQMTNIGAGMRQARLEMVANARPRAARVIVLVTDGAANESSTSASPYNFCINEARLCKAAGIQIMAVSLGAEADTGLMQQIADITEGQHFVVPGGASIDVVTEDLKQVFGKIASDRPLKLIHEND